MRFFIAQGFGGGDDFAEVCLSAIIGVEVKKSEEVLDLRNVEGGIGSNDGLGENDLSLVFDYFFLF